MGRVLILFFTAMVLNSAKAAAQLNLKPSTDTVERKISLKVLPQNFYNNRMGYFCKKEVQLQKLVSLPVFIRLGSKDYVDYLERKPNATGHH
jgi:hypothetical protein